MSDRLVIGTAGYAPRDSERAKLRVHVGVNRCGHIEDGVSFEHGRQGCWLISFADLKRIYEAAASLRPGGEEKESE